MAGSNMRPVLGKSEGDGAWRRLWAAWQQARAGAGSMVALAGDPGMGKSHLLGVLADRVRPAAQVRWVSASDPPSGTPYALLADAFDTERFPDSLDGHEAGRLIRERLSAQADNSAVLVVLDDLHVADEPSLRALRYLAAHMPAGEVLVAVGYRPRQAPAALLPILPARSAAVVLEPVPEAIAAEIAGCADARLAELRRFCEGNPLYLSALADQPGHEAAGSRHGELLRAWVRAELTRDLGELSATARVVAQAAAVAGERAELGLLQGICRIDEDQVLAAVDELAGADVLRAAGPCYAFRHPLVGRAVLEATGPSWRIAAHRRALELLRERKAPVEELARHLEWLPADGGREQADLFAAAG